MPLILGTNSIKASGYDVANSLRFNKAGGSEDFLDLQYSADGNRRTFTISFWMKISKLDTNMYPISISDTSSGYQADIRHSSANQLRMYATDTAGTPRLHLLTNRVFRDTTSFYHICWQVDTTQSTESSRVKLFVNGTQETSFATETYPPQNTDLRWNGRNNADTGGVTRVGAIQGGTGSYDGYLAEVCFIDGTALDCTSFGEFDSDSPTIWKPIDVSGLTFGTNGFYLEFKQSGSSQNSSGMGADTSGSNNHFAVNNLSNSVSTDTCTNNHATLNYLVNNAGQMMDLTDGNLTAESTTSSAAWKTAVSTIGLTKGKWFWEMKFINVHNTYNNGVMGENVFTANATNPMNQTGWTGFYNVDGGEIRKDNAITTNDYGTYATNDIMSIALDVDNYTITFYKNGSAFVSNVALSTTGRDTLFPASVYYQTNGGAQVSYNFGSPPYSESGGNSDANGYGNFSMAVPSNHFSINTKNLAEYG